MPPGVYDGATLLSDNVEIPFPGFRIDWFTNRPQQAQAIERSVYNPIDGFFTGGDPYDGVIYQTILIWNNASRKYEPAPNPQQYWYSPNLHGSSSIDYSLGDLNLDGYVDLVINDLGMEFDTNDQIVYSTGQTLNGTAMAVTAIDENFRKFFDNINGWYLDQNYFSYYQNTYTYAVTETTAGICYDYSYEGDYPVGYPCSEIYIETGQYSEYSNEVSLDAVYFVDALRRAENSDFSDDQALEDMAEIYSRVIGTTSNSFVARTNGVSGAYWGEDEDDIGPVEHSIRLSTMTGLIVRIVIGDPVVDLILESDPNNWERHVYGLENEICSSDEDTVVMEGGSNIPRGTIPAAVCTVENVFCWARRRPAPRSEDSDNSLAKDGENETLAGIPFSGRTDPIITRVDEVNHGYRNETDDGHLLNDPNQTEGCADYTDYPNRTDIPDRCSYVDRNVYEGSNGVVRISTHGAGYNPVETVFNPVTNTWNTYDFATLNELAGIFIFNSVDLWVQQQLMD